MRKGRIVFRAAVSVTVLAVVLSLSGGVGFSFTGGSDALKSIKDMNDIGQSRLLNSAVPAADLEPVIRWTVFPEKGTGRGISVDSNGNIYIVGESNESIGSPIRPHSGGMDAFVAKLDSSGTLLWNTYLGGSGDDHGCSIALDPSGNIYVSGDGTMTWGMPVHPRTGGYDAFIAKLDNNGVLQWNTFLGGSGDDYGRSISLDHNNSIFVAGDGTSTWGIPIRLFSGGIDAFAAKLDNNGVLIWNTFLGGEGEDYGRGIQLDASGNIYIVGDSGSTWGVPISDGNGCFLIKLDDSGILQWNTFLGGSGYCTKVNESGIYIGGSIYIGESWYSPFIAKLTLNGSMEWRTNLSIHAWSACCYGIDFDKDGGILGAATLAWTYPTAYAVKVSDDGVEEWAVQVSYSGGSSLGYSSGSSSFSIASGPNECSFITGKSWYVNSWVNIGIGGAFVAKLSEKKISLISPNGGESWAFASIQNIQWTTEGDAPQVKIEYSTDNGSNWTTIDESTQNTGSYPWLIPNTPSDQCLVRVSDADFSTITDQSDAVFTIFVSPFPYIVLDPSSMNFGASDGQGTSSQSLFIGNTGGGTMNWTAAGNQPWISAAPASGTGEGIVQVGVNPAGLAPGAYQGKVDVAVPDGLNSPQSIDVYLSITASGESGLPFGSFDTPVEGMTACSSIPVTGWALDDLEVVGVKIYRDPVAGESTQPNGLVYIGDGVFVEGARGDVEALYPGYPLNSRAGWGYMLLTNFLPNGGNGSFVLYAIATDREGHEAILGSKTIVCDNANAVLPFGAIDTPAQGGTASGSAFVNFGWALTPPYKIIPTDGSTITVWVDGLPLGHPAYNNYRADIATLFPGYLNSNGAVGVYHLDTTGYNNGVHTIAWSVTDSDGMTEGIGSRYFNILNLDGGAGSSGLSGNEASGAGDAIERRLGKYRSPTEIASLYEDTRAPVWVRRETAADAPAEIVMPDSDGSIRISILEVKRVAIYLNERDAKESIADMVDRGNRLHRKAGLNEVNYEAFELALDRIRPLPIGASFDPRDGVLSWQPGPGFLGEFTFVIVKSENGRAISRKNVIVRISSREILNDLRN